MPTYIYKCEVHGEFEEIHSITEKIEDCPKCKEDGVEPKKVTRLISGNGNFILSGSGWGRDNYG